MLDASDPVVQLVVTITQSLDPSTKRWCEPRYFNTSWVELPLSWHSEVVELVDGLNKLLSHDDSTINCHDYVLKDGSDNVQNLLELFEFLSKEDVEWDVLVWIKTLGGD